MIYDIEFHNLPVHRLSCGYPSVSLPAKQGFVMVEMLKLLVLSALVLAEVERNAVSTLRLRYQVEPRVSTTIYLHFRKAPSGDCRTDLVQMVRSIDIPTRS